MKIEVIGHKGTVGNATLELFRQLGHDVTGSDVGDKINYASIYFVCTPEGVVEEVVDKISTQMRPLIVIRSTTIPGTCKKLATKIDYVHICHNPEFLREAMALQDEFSPHRIVIGECCREHGDTLEALYKPLQRPIVRTNPTTSELVKLASNNYLSCAISYWNTIEEIARKIGVSGHEVGMIASLDPRISPYGSRFHKRYDGRCLPKDVKQLIEFAESIGCSTALLRTIEEVNGK